MFASTYRKRGRASARAAAASSADDGAARRRRLLPALSALRRRPRAETAEVGEESPRTPSCWDADETHGACVGGWGAATAVRGRRPTQEDAFAMCDVRLTADERAPPARVAIVADGHSGRDVADIGHLRRSRRRCLADMAVSWLPEEVAARGAALRGDPPSALRAAVYRALTAAGAERGGACAVLSVDLGDRHLQ
eukprot:gene12001-15039_t